LAKTIERFIDSSSERARSISYSAIGAALSECKDMKKRQQMTGYLVHGLSDFTTYNRSATAKLLRDGLKSDYTPESKARVLEASQAHELTPSFVLVIGVAEVRELEQQLRKNAAKLPSQYDYLTDRDAWNPCLVLARWGDRESFERIKAYYDSSTDSAWRYFDALADMTYIRNDFVLDHLRTLMASDEIIMDSWLTKGSPPFPNGLAAASFAANFLSRLLPDFPRGTEIGGGSPLSYYNAQEIESCRDWLRAHPQITIER
jgi:hypothetical protein